MQGLADRQSSGQADLRVLEEEGQLLGYEVQLAGIRAPEKVAFADEVVFQEALAHTLVQLSHQAQEPSAQHLPVLGVGVLLASPEEHRLQVVGRENRPLPRTPDVLLQLSHDLQAPPAAASILVQLLQQHPLSLLEAQLPVIARASQQVEPKRLERETRRGEMRNQAS